MLDSDQCGSYGLVSLVSIMIEKLENVLRGGIANHLEAKDSLMVEQH